MPIAVGDLLPDVTLLRITAEQPEPIELRAYSAGRRVVLFAVPGAFTPTCSARHLPGFLTHAVQLRERGVAAIACVAVNDPHVLKAWAAHEGVDNRIDLLSDGAAIFTGAIGLELDLSARFFGVRSRRYAAIVDDGRLTYLGVEPGTEVGVSSVDAVLERLG